MKPQPLTAAIIAYMKPGEERADAQCAGLRVRCSDTGRKVFFYRYRGRDGALRQIKLGEFDALTLAKARKAVERKRLEREEGKDPQLEKRKLKEEAARERAAQRQVAYQRMWLQGKTQHSVRAALEMLTASNVVPVSAA